MSLKVRDVIRELKQFPDDYKVAFESYEVEGDGYRLYNVRIVEKDEDNGGGYRKTRCISVNKDVDAEKFVVIK